MYLFCIHQFLDAVSRYEFQQKVSHNAEAPKVLAPVRKAAPRVEYFKGKFTKFN